MCKKNPEDLSVRQIHYLLLEKRRSVRESRLARFHRTGRVVPVLGKLITTGQGLDSLRSSQNGRLSTKRPQLWLDGILLAAEFLAVIGFVAVLGLGLSTLGGFNRTVDARVT